MEVGAAAKRRPVAPRRGAATALQSPLVVHRLPDAGTARIAAFAFNPLYRADPEREWPMASSAAHLVDQ